MLCSIEKMKEIIQKDFERLNECYLAGDYNSFKVIHSELLKVLRKLSRLGEIQVPYKGTLVLIDSEENFFAWVSNCFPNILKDLVQGNKSILNEDKDFPKFKEIKLLPNQIKCDNVFWRIKKLEVFGQKQKVKQNFQRIIEINWEQDELLLVFKLENDASLRIYNPEYIFESYYLLRIEEADSVEFKVKNNYLKFRRTKDELIEFKKEDVVENIVGKSIFLDSVEIIK
jgi:hypothetical protein